MVLPGTGIRRLPAGVHHGSASQVCTVGGITLMESRYVPCFGTSAHSHDRACFSLPRTSRTSLPIPRKSLNRSRSNLVRVRHPPDHRRVLGCSGDTWSST
jgi:hypothetical protein